MTADFHRTALLFEERASQLPHDSEHRLRLLRLASGLRRIAIEEAAKRQG